MSVALVFYVGTKSSLHILFLVLLHCASVVALCLCCFNALVHLLLFHHISCFCVVSLLFTITTSFPLCWLFHCTYFLCIAFLPMDYTIIFYVAQMLLLLPCAYFSIVFACPSFVASSIKWLILSFFAFIVPCFWIICFIFKFFFWFIYTSFLFSFVFISHVKACYALLVFTILAFFCFYFFLCDFMWNPLFYIAHVFSLCVVLLSKLSSIYIFCFYYFVFICLCLLNLFLFICCLQVIVTIWLFSMSWLCTTSLLASMKGLYLFIFVCFFFLHWCVFLWSPSCTLVCCFAM